MLFLSRVAKSVPNHSLIPIFIRSFTSSRWLLNKTDVEFPDTEKPNRQKRHAPARTLEDSLKLSKTEDAGVEKPEQGETQSVKESTKPLDFITTGPKIPEKWRKMDQLPEWKRQKFGLIEKLEGQKWNPQRKLSREEMKSVKLLKESLPNLTTTDISKHFQISPEAARRILKSKWKPSESEEDDLHDRWKKRGEKLKSQLKDIYLQKEGSTPKVIINSGKEYNKVRVSKTGNIYANNGQKKVKEYGGEKRIRNLHNTNKLRKMKF